MEAPKKIWTNDVPWPEFIGYREDSGYNVKYIRADLVEKLEDYVSHSRDCRKLRSFKDPCTCGLTELLGEME